MQLKNNTRINFFYSVRKAIQTNLTQHLSLLLILIIATLFTFFCFIIEQKTSSANIIGNSANFSSDCGGNLLWSNGFDNPNWQSSWNISTNQNFGEQNQQLIDSNGNKILRVKYAKGTWSPSDTVAAGMAVGGTQFISTGNGFPLDKACLNYKLKFAPNFDFVKGGKLPGMYAGTKNSGGNIPDGTNGLSTRYMWRRLGDGEVYAYLPSSVDSGTSLGRGNWRFVPDRWYNITQEVSLNTPGSSDGYIKVWLDGNLVLNQTNIVFRTVESLKIEGVFFSTFFGGDDSTWATPNDTYTEFDDFQVFGYDNIVNSSNPTQTNATTLNLKVNLSSPFNDSTDTMDNPLRTRGLIPNNQPYNTAPFSYTGSETITAANMPSNTVDWILLEIKDGSNNLLGKRAMLLLSDGTLFDPITKTPGLKLDSNPSPNQSYRFVVRHRNHLAISTTSAITINTNSTYTLDLTNTNNNNQIQVGTKSTNNLPIYGLRKGNADGNNVIISTDRTLIRNSSEADGVYSPKDLNLDGAINSTDRIISRYSPESTEMFD